MAAFSAPVQHADTESTLGYSAVYAAEITMALEEMLDPASLGLITGVGDLAGTGSDTLNLTYLDGIGWGESFTALSTETEDIPLTGFTAVNDTVTIGRYGLAKSETYQYRILGRVPQTFLDSLVGLVPSSLARTIHEQMTSKFTSVSGVAGTSGAAYTFDDELDLLALFNETEGFQGDAITQRHPEQWTDLYESMRNEPGYQTPEMMAMLFQLRGQGAASNFLGYSSAVSTNRVTQSGGDHIGCAYAPGAFVLARASTASLANENPGAEIVAPQLGLYIARTSTARNGQGRFDAQAWFGIAQRSVAVAPAFRVRSVDD